MSGTDEELNENFEVEETGEGESDNDGGQESEEEEEDEEESREAHIFYQQNFLRMEDIDEEALAVYLSTRELDENDYELLLRLDENVKKKTLNQEKIQKLKTIHCKEEKEISIQNCTVCLETIKKNEIISILPCKHEFHQNCIETWLKEYSKHCPLCKKEM